MVAGRLQPQLEGEPGRRLAEPRPGEPLELTDREPDPPGELGRLCRSTGAGAWRTFRSVRLPSALPQLRVWIGGAAVDDTVGATIAEWIGGVAGLGYSIHIATGDLRMDLGFAIVLVLAALGLALFDLVVLVERLSIPCHASQRLAFGTSAPGRAHGSSGELAPAPAAPPQRGRGRPVADHPNAALPEGRDTGAW